MPNSFLLEHAKSDGRKLELEEVGAGGGEESRVSSEEKVVPSAASMTPILSTAVCLGVVQLYDKPTSNGATGIARGRS